MLSASLLWLGAAAAAEPPRFPYGAYSDPPFGCLFKPAGPGCGGRTDYKDLPEKEVVHGFNLFTPYLSESAGHNASSWAAIEKYLVRAEALGVTVSYALNHLCAAAPVGCNATQRDLIAGEVRRVANYSAIVSWYLADEPDGSHIDAGDVAAASAMIRAMDSRPVTLVLDSSVRPADPARELEYAKAADILMADPYPIGTRCDVGAAGCNNVSAVVDATNAVSLLAVQATKTDGRHRQVIMVPQAFGALGHQWTRNPTRQEGRVMVYLMLLYGAKGILLYARRAPYVMPTNFQLWSEYRLIAMELIEIGPALLGGDVSVPTVVIVGATCDAAPAPVGATAAAAGTGVTARVLDTPTETIVLLANVGNTSKTFGLSSPVLPQGLGVPLEVLFENRALLLGGQGFFTDTIDAMGTRAYRYSKLAAPPAGPRPLLVNGGFEQASSVGVPDGTYAVPYGDLGASFLVDARIAAAGRHSLRVTTPTADQGVGLLFSTFAELVPPAGGAAASLNFSLAVRHDFNGAPKRIQFGLQARGDETVPCCVPGPAVESRGAGAFETLSKSIPVPAGCQLHLCEVTFQLLSAGVVYIDEVKLEWE